MNNFLASTVLLSLLAVSFAFAGDKECQRELMNGRAKLGMRAADQSFSSMTGSGGDVDPLNLSRFLRVKKQLALTPEQADLIENLRLGLKKDAIEKNAEVRSVRSELNALLRVPAPDFASVREKIEKISSLQLQLKSAVIDAYEQAYNALTPDQKTKFTALLSSKKE